MRVTQKDLFTYIDSVNKDELLALKSLLIDTDESGNVRSLLLRNSTGWQYFTGLTGFLCRNCNFNIDISVDETPDKPELKDIIVDRDILDGITLRDYQISATRKNLYFGRGINEAATGSGKTAMMAALIKHRPNRVLILVPTGFLMQQHASKFEEFGIDSVGRVGFGYNETNKKVTVAVVNSAYRAINKDFCPWVQDADTLLLDEAHHSKSEMWFKVCNSCKAPYRYAFTATAFENPEKICWDDLALIGATGPVIFEIRSKQLRNRGYLADPFVTVIRTNSPRLNKVVKTWNLVYKTGIVNNGVRNALITSLANSCHNGDFKTLVFVGHKVHGHKLSKMTAEYFGNECIFVQGSSLVTIYSPSGTVKNQKWNIDDVADYVNGNKQVTVYTTTVLDEGIDIPIINVLIMATGMKKYRRSVQRSGRGMRPKDGENKVYIFDFHDNNHYFLKNQSDYRLWTYQREEFDFSDSIDHTEKVMGIKLDLQRGLK